MNRLVLLFVIILPCFANCEQHNDITLEKAKKIIETKYYEPIRQKEEWVCGREINTFEDFHTIISYDSYDNEIIEKRFNDDGRIWMIIKNFYYLPKEHKLAKREVEYPIRKRLETANWIRDNRGNLLEIRGDISSLSNFREMSYEYDELGRRIKENWDTFTKRIQYNPENQSTTATQYEVYDSECDYSYQFKNGLIKSGISFEDKKTGLLVRTIEEEYKYGYLNKKQDIKYEYNTDGKLTLKYIYETSREAAFGVPVGLTHEEAEKYIIQNYYENNPNPHIKQEYKFTYSYNKYGDCIEYIFSNKKIHFVHVANDFVRCSS